MRKNKNKKPEVIVACSKCGENYVLDTIRELDGVHINTPCQKCGFLLFKHIVNKMHAMVELLQNDMHAKELLKQGKHEEFDDYLTLKMETKNPNKIA